LTISSKDYFRQKNYGVPFTPCRPDLSGKIHRAEEEPPLPTLSTLASRQLLPDGVGANLKARFAQAGCETGFDAGNLGAFPACDGPAVAFIQSRNRFRRASYCNTDFTIMKNTKFPSWENASLGL